MYSQQGWWEIKEGILETLELAHEIVEAIASRMGSDIVLLDIHEITLIADYFVIATGESERQLRALSEGIAEMLKENHGMVPLSIEGMPPSGWILLDLGAIVVHLFSPQQRAYYQLEELWSRGRTIVRMA